MAAIGLRLPDNTYDGYSLNEIVETAQMAETLGYESVWYPEGRAWDVFVILGHLAEHTDCIELASGITPVYARVPAQLAMSLATVDKLSEGRAVLGTGASSRITVEQWHGIPFERPLRRIRETIEIVKAAWHNDVVDYDGELFDVDEYKRAFEPVRDDIPIYNAALGERNRELTGKFADGWLPVNIPIGRMADFIEEMQSASVEAGRDPDAVRVAPYIITCVSEDRERARDQVRKTLAYYMGGMDYYANVFTNFGFGDVVDSIGEAWDVGERDKARRRVTDEVVDSVAIAGTPEEGRRQLDEYREAGVDMPIVYPPQAPKELIETTIEALGPGSQ